MAGMKTVMALGFFDGLHMGHGALLEKVKSRAAEYGMEPAVLSFDVHPDNLVSGHEVSLIFDSEEKKRQLRDIFGIDRIIFLRFTDDLMKMSWSNFLDLLVSGFNVGRLVVGHDFTFGYKGEGKTEQLEQYCREHGIGCDVIPPVYLEERIVSSTLIRELISSGDIASADRFLGHPYYIPGTVIHGLHNGEKLGFPTLNIKMPRGLVTPRFGVYAALVEIEGKQYPAATDIGVKPTVCSDGEVLVESHLLDFGGDIYGAEVRVFPKKFIRPEMHFSDFRQLTEAISGDVAEIRAYFENERGEGSER